MDRDRTRESSSRPTADLCRSTRRPVIAFFGTSSLTVDGRNEVRAVYGGFGVAVSALLFGALAAPELARGIEISVAIALLGMAFGRVVSRLIDGGAGRYPWLFLGVEIALAACLLGAAARPV